jgi:bifunctional DNA-binding transcriptional regulator/antitoxin component of YhaV-PrlF toxin-antitoxin module
MKLQKRIGRKYQGKVYYKYSVDIPSETIEALGWEKGTEIKKTVQGKKLILEP